MRIGEAGRRKNVIDGSRRPRVRIVGAHHNLIWAGGRNQMSQRFGTEHQRIEI